MRENIDKLKSYFNFKYDESNEDEQELLTKEEVLEIECHLVRTFLFDLVLYSTLDKGEFHISSQQQVWIQHEDCFWNMERLEKENVKCVLVIPATLIRSDKVSGIAHSAQGLTAVSAQAVNRVYVSKNPDPEQDLADLIQNPISRRQWGA
ncbi:hypothetical protein B0T17DRAFT_512458 [Bombardia bombarda]|uniref:Uncharacterized protein n=1 Tax=Bombardia bombarda TaxID=252184 RepID=A0AA39TRA0_9PEZI|nr:hypothetical protein B0T17DRAFT_512458 [Bombardia bombarda]